MAYKFPSAEWTEQLHEQVNSSDAYASAAKTWEGDLLLVIDGGGAIYLDLWHGACRGPYSEHCHGSCHGACRGPSSEHCRGSGHGACRGPSSEHGPGSCRGSGPGPNAEHCPESPHGSCP